MSSIDFKSICGILNVHKPAGMTSRIAVTEVEWHLRRLAREQGQKLSKGTVKVGHAGTLDPLATGVLVVCIGKASRLVPFVQDQPKTYEAAFTLGARSDSDDTEGTIEEVPDAPRPTRDEIERALAPYQGVIEQVPPQFSAVHVDGKRAYKLARKGEAIALNARPVEVHQIELLDYEWPELKLRIECGSGTYIRSLARDLGDDLGCGGLMHGLIRTGIGPFQLEHGLTIAEIKETNWLSALQPPVVAVTHLPTYRCDSEEQDWLVNGRMIAPHPDGIWNTARGDVSVINDEGELVCLAKARKLKKPWRVNEKAGEQLGLQPRLVFLAINAANE